MWLGMPGKVEEVAAASTPGTLRSVSRMRPSASAIEALVSAGEVLKVIEELAREGRSMMLVTHEIRFAQNVADRVVFMDGGVIVEQGPPGEVIRRPRHERTRSFLSQLLADG